MLDSLEPKYDSQLETLLAIDKLFFKSLKKRDSLIKDDEKGYSEKNRGYLPDKGWFVYKPPAS